MNLHPTDCRLLGTAAGEKGATAMEEARQPNGDGWRMDRV
jgi:hypothetical protein